MNSDLSSDLQQTMKAMKQGLCMFCRERPATLHFGDALSFTHGGALNCCEICAAEKQLEHARERAAAIPELEARLSALLAEEAMG